MQLKKTGTSSPRAEAPGERQQPQPHEDAVLAYEGQAPFIATGTVTGKKYRFNFSGDRLLIDYRDVPSMLAVPGIKHVPAW